MKIILGLVLFCLLSSGVSAQAFQIINGDTVNRVDASGLKQGRWIVAGQFETRGNYKNGAKEGQWLTYFGGNYLRIVENFEKDKLSGAVLELDRWGRLISERYYSNGILNGPSKTFTSDGFFTSYAEYRDGKLNGVKRAYYENTPDKVMEEAYYKDDQKNGLSKWLTQEGRIVAEYNYVNGLLEGELKTYYASGKPMLLEHYINNLRQGESLEYFESGKLKVKGLYKDDLKEGEWLGYDENQAIVSREKFKTGVSVKR
jgi:antitoxin component YwqK of YwqJK toxin-antitoxin module